MKRSILTRAIVLLLCIYLCGCTGGSQQNSNTEAAPDTKAETSVPVTPNENDTKESLDDISEQEYVLTNYICGVDSGMVSSENGCYFVVNGFIMHYDEKTMQTDFVCSVPGCRHKLTKQEISSDQAPKCHAFVGISEIYYYGGNIFYERYTDPGSNTRKYEIIRLSADGSSINTAAEISVPYVPFTSVSDTAMLVHNGYLYYSVSELKVDNKTMKRTPTRTSVYRLDLDDDTAKPELWLDNDDFEETGIPCIKKLSAYKDKLLLIRNSSSLIEDVKYPDRKRFPIMCVDTESKKITDLSEHYEIPEDQQIMFPYYSVIDGGLVFMLCKEDDDHTWTKTLYSIDLDGNNVRKLLTMPDSCWQFAADDENFYVFSNDQDMKIYIYDHLMKLINTVELSAGIYIKEAEPDAGLLYAENKTVNYLFPIGSDKIYIFGYLQEGRTLPEMNAINYYYYPYIKYVEKAELLKKDGDPLCTLIFKSGAESALPISLS